MMVSRGARVTDFDEHTVKVILQRIRVRCPTCKEFRILSDCSLMQDTESINDLLTCSYCHHELACIMSYTTGSSHCVLLGTYAETEIELVDIQGDKTVKWIISEYMLNASHSIISFLLKSISSLTRMLFHS